MRTSVANIGHVAAFKSADRKLLRVAERRAQAVSSSARRASGAPAKQRPDKQRRPTTNEPGETMQPNSHWAAIIGLAVLALPASPARAQDYPTRTVTIVAASAPGGMYSILARLIGGKLERLYGKSFVVENRPGASSVTGAVAVMRAPPDGYTLMVATSSTLATNVTLHKNLPYDPLTDFVPITLIALSPEVLLINASLPVRSIADLVTLARTTPGGLSFGSAGPGTAQHLNGELLKAALGVELHHIPYKSVAGLHTPPHASTGVGLSSCNPCQTLHWLPCALYSHIHTCPGQFRDSGRSPWLGIPVHHR